jgi:ferrous iron transport protein A
VPDGSEAIVTGYYGGDGVRRKAMDLGLVPGASVQVLVRGAGRLLVVLVGETRIMIGHGVAQHVRVLVKE